MQHALQNVRYEKGLYPARLNEPSGLPEPGGIKYDHPKISWIADNQMKGISNVSALTIHSTADFAAATWHQTHDEKIELILDDIKSLMKVSIKSAQTHRWGYTLPINPHKEKSLTSLDLQLTLAGDAFGGPRVEGARLLRPPCCRTNHPRKLEKNPLPREALSALPSGLHLGGNLLYLKSIELVALKVSRKKRNSNSNRE